MGLFRQSHERVRLVRTFPLSLKRLPILLYAEAREAGASIVRAFPNRSLGTSVAPGRWPGFFYNQIGCRMPSWLGGGKLDLPALNGYDGSIFSSLIAEIPMIVNVSEAKASLSKLMDMACQGEEVIIAGNILPLVELVPHTPRTKRKLGLLSRNSFCGTGGVMQ